YVYDSSGQRVRKVVRKGSVTEERLYLGSIEIFRRSTAGTLTLERETMQVNIDARRIAMIDTPIIRPVGSSETQLMRYQYSNHLGTACLELDDAAQIVSYEEYYAFGSTSYQGTDTTREVPSKRYRYTGKERDEETGFYYHGARYYTPWLARWTATDPAGVTDGLNVYTYCNSNPIILHDPKVTDGEKHDEGSRPAPKPKPAAKPPPAPKSRGKRTADSAHPSEWRFHWRPHVPLVPQLHLNRTLPDPITPQHPGPLPASLFIEPPPPVFPPLFAFPVPTPAPAGDEPPPPLLREDAQAIIFGGYDPGSGGGVG